MKWIKSFLVFENENPNVELTDEQIKWLDECSRGENGWTLNTGTGLVDVDGDFSCREQNLTDFKGIRFGDVRGSFDCGVNQLTSLKGAPRSVSATFYCEHNQLTSLEGSPEKVGGSFWCNQNQLTSLEGAPKSVGESFGGGFNCENNQITSLEGAPKGIPGLFWSSKNPVSEPVLQSIYSLMKNGEGYLDAVRKNWEQIPLEDKILLYRPEFKWVSGEESRKLKALSNYDRIKDFI